MKQLSQQLVGAGTIALGGLLALGARHIPSEAGYSGVGANFLPWVVAVALAVLGAWLVWEARSGGFRMLEGHDEAARPDWTSLAWVAAGLLLNAALVTRLGFIVSCSLLFALAVRGLRRAGGEPTPLARSAADLLIGAAISAPTYWLFTKALGLNLPGLTTTGWI
ncbi:tripartite tricarboxylate transporter TctB family protein [Aquabacterium sp. A7-Y]|uniref:tripartite tricarboxylate transporter TctB family protein n=1 Tax=Aquabacterium sp. A7-Y TaxID=1349605 RepID=UPI00223CC0A4|nr:tripartite tricarboxylate transporter TctB family protein [Aquabacterium sp. A7-Y]MCW7537750.1 tripartite tricarboxylate transporter TctB family protein [Aquabacterium sp. A7-Y]